jgi:hypothetical protein
MRDKNQTFIQFQKQVEEYVTRRLLLSSFLTTSVTIDPTVLEGYDIIYPRKYEEVENLILIHWFLPENLQWRVYLDLEEKEFSHFNKKQRMILSILLNSKRDCLLYFYETDNFSSHEFWGKLGRSVKLQLKLIPKNKKITKPKRKRGYDDKGSRRPEDKWLPSHDYTFTLLHLKKDYEKYQHNRTIKRILIYFENLYRND